MNRKLWVGLLIGLGAAIILLFGFRLVHVIRRGGLPLRPQPLATITDASLIREWMTIPYIAHTYGLPDQTLFDALEIPETDNRRKSLEEINEQYFPIDKGFVLERVQQAVLAFQEHEILPAVSLTPMSLPVTPKP